MKHEHKRLRSRLRAFSVHLSPTWAGNIARPGGQVVSNYVDRAQRAKRGDVKAPRGASFEPPLVRDKRTIKGNRYATAPAGTRAAHRRGGDHYAGNVPESVRLRSARCARREVAMTEHRRKSKRDRARLARFAHAVHGALQPDEVARVVHVPSRCGYDLTVRRGDGGWRAFVSDMLHNYGALMARLTANR